MHQIMQASQEWENKVQRAFKRDKDPHRAQKQLGECGEFAVVVKFSGRAVVGLFGWSSGDVLLIQGGVIGVVLS